MQGTNIVPTYFEKRQPAADVQSSTLQQTTHIFKADRVLGVSGYIGIFRYHSN